MNNITVPVGGNRREAARTYAAASSTPAALESCTGTLTRTRSSAENLAIMDRFRPQGRAHNRMTAKGCQKTSSMNPKSNPVNELRPLAPFSRFREMPKFTQKLYGFGLHSTESTAYSLPSAQKPTRNCKESAQNPHRNHKVS